MYKYILLRKKIISIAKKTSNQDILNKLEHLNNLCIKVIQKKQKNNFRNIELCKQYFLKLNYNLNQIIKNN